jgi:hypothetical protein
MLKFDNTSEQFVGFPTTFATEHLGEFCCLLGVFGLVDEVTPAATYFHGGVFVL